MLAKKERLDRKAFDRFFVSGKRFHTANFQLIYTAQPAFHGSVVVGKKVFKSAVRRNRLRRRVYAVLYRLKDAPTPAGVFIIIAKPAAGTLIQAKIAPEIEQLILQVRY